MAAEATDIAESKLADVYTWSCKFRMHRYNWALVACRISAIVMSPVNKLTMFHVASKILLRNNPSRVPYFPLISCNRSIEFGVTGHIRINVYISVFPTLMYIGREMCSTTSVALVTIVLSLDNCVILVSHSEKKPIGIEH